ncbi:MULTISPECIES: TIGR00730 family Rossman fold protein [unclassified Siphonobacter]|uniref:LOG family protein n=1 Tax=unclassified Siphonobacter TaxID=2635712 RepID=UPI000CB26A06|nr:MULTISPECIES: TIGR00730 family Rossman fold protein [unclassified Siphonobacter]PKK35277.1 Rossman fold protein, TIGR00730 family [Siphonobacter sp. SORGH_AS_0500]
MKKVAVFCGASSGSDLIYREVAAALGTYLANRQLTLVYGGGNVGLMGIVADAALAAGGEVIGVIPDFLKKWEVGHEGVTELIVTENMHERKARMAELSDGFITLPGGFGSMDELFEILTWKQLQIHKKPVGLLNINGFYDLLIAQMDRMVEAGFLRDSNRDLLVIADSIEELIALMQTHEPIVAEKWVDRKKI